MNTVVSSSEIYRANQLDTIAAVLPHHQRDALATLLTDDDIATLKHLVDKGLGANTLRAMASDLAYLDAWTHAATGAALPWPAPQPLLLKFIAHHLWDAEKRVETCGHGMPDDIADRLSVNRRRTLTPDRTAILTPSVRARFAGRGRSCGA